MFDRGELIREALTARRMAYVPYSHFQVGAALLGKSGKIYRGCNIENASLTPTNCAERTAFFKAVSEGEQEFTAIAIVGGREGAEPSALCAPCGVCRQVMAEFCGLEDFKVILAIDEGVYEEFALGALFPKAFTPSSL